MNISHGKAKCLGSIEDDWTSDGHGMQGCVAANLHTPLSPLVETGFKPVSTRGESHLSSTSIGEKIEIP